MKAENSVAKQWNATRLEDSLQRYYIHSRAHSALNPILIHFTYRLVFEEENLRKMSYAVDSERIDRDSALFLNNCSLTLQ